MDTLRRLLLLHRFLPCRDPDPEEDPTPALRVGEASRDEGGCSPPRPPRLPACLEGSQSVEGAEPGRPGSPEEEPPVGWPPPLEPEGPPSAGGHGSYKVVRKGRGLLSGRGGGVLEGAGWLGMGALRVPGLCSTPLHLVSVPLLSLAVLRVF